MALAILPGAACACSTPSPDPPSYSAAERIGALYSPAELRGRELFGVRLGMPLDEARRALVAGGFVQRFDNELEDVVTAGRSSEADDLWFTERFGEVVALSYVRFAGGPARIAAINYSQPLTLEQERQVEARRGEIVARFGAPSYRLSWVNEEGRVQDSMAWVASARLRDSSFRSDVWSCHVNWVCPKRRARRCFEALPQAREPVIEVDFVYRAISFTLSDYALQYESLRRNRDFAARRRPQAICIVPSIH
jgi:hypothetical protein